jgi:hypothetical protein
MLNTNDAGFQYETIGHIHHNFISLCAEESSHLIHSILE